MDGEMEMPEVNDSAFGEFVGFVLADPRHIQEYSVEALDEFQQICQRRWSTPSEIRFRATWSALGTMCQREIDRKLREG
jgi:hypothetical protein